MMPLIACTHPGRNGDLLFCIPTMQSLARKHRAKVDVYTSDWCRPMEPIFRAQSFVNDFIVPPDYVIKEHSFGIQPWDMPVPGGHRPALHRRYAEVYQLGFKSPPTQFLGDHISQSVGIAGHLPMELEYPKIRQIQDDYLIACTKSVNECYHYFHETPDFFERMNERMPVVCIGMDNLRPEIKLARIRPDFLEVCALMHNSRGVLSMPSTPHSIAAFIQGVKMVTLRQPYRPVYEMYQSPRQLIINPPRASVEEACKFLGI